MSLLQSFAHYGAVYAANSLVCQFEKQFEITYSLLDALTISSASQTVDHYEILRYLLLSMSASPNSRQIYVRTLEKKMGGGPEGTAEQKYRHLAGVQLFRDDGHSRQHSRRHSVVGHQIGARQFP